MTLRHLSLFSGIGGFDLGFGRAGIETVGFVENDRHCQTVLRAHWPDVPIWTDINEVTADELPGCDVLSGGFPCQDYSVAGRREGLVGDRGALWWQMHRLIEQLSPAVVVGENVPGLLSSRGGADFATIIDSLVALRFGVAWRVLDSQWFGVPQRRRRVYIVAVRDSGTVDASEICAVPEGVCGDTPTRPEAGEAVAGTLGARTRAGGFPGTDAATSGFLVFNWQTGQDQLQADGDATPSLHVGQTPAVAFTHSGYSNQPAWITGDRTDCLSASGHHSSSAQGIGVTDGAQVRRLTPVECARLQGFPDDWNEMCSDTQRYRQYGNAVTVNVAEWLGRRIVFGVGGG